MDFIAIDFETANHNRSSACQVGLAKVIDNEIVEHKSYYIKPTPNYYEAINKQIHHIDESMTDDKPTFKELWETELESYLSGFDLVAHNAPFEKSVFNAIEESFSFGLLSDSPFPKRIYCSLAISRYYCPQLINYRLDTVCDALNITLGNHHNAEDDAIGAANIILALANKYELDSLAKFNWTYSSAKSSKNSNCEDIFSCDNYKADEDLIKGKTFCITGKLSYIRRDVAAEVIKNAGGFYANSLTKKVNYLVTGDLSLFGDDYQSGKLKKAKEMKDAGCDIELITESQLQEMIIYEGKKITKKMIQVDSDEFLAANRRNILINKFIYLSEGFPNKITDAMPYLGANLTPNLYDEDVINTDYFFISNQVINDLFENNHKSKAVLKIEDAMNAQSNPDGNPDKHYVKLINEDTLNIYLKKVSDYNKGLTKMKLADWDISDYVGHKLTKEDENN